MGSITVILAPTSVKSKKKRNFKQDRLKGIHIISCKNCVFTSDQFLDLPQHHIAESQHWVLTHYALDSAFFRDHWLRIYLKIFASDHSDKSALKYTFNTKKTPKW